jgi:hypothetical protein
MARAVIARFKRAIQYPPALEVKFGLSIQTEEYWIARSSRAMTALCDLDATLPSARDRGNAA